jgi:hypothetical protein
MRKLSIPHEFLRPKGIDPREMSLVLRLREAGLDVVSTFELKQTNEAYPEAVPVLVDYLHSKEIDRDVLDHVLRALTVKEARGIAFEPIYQMYLKDTDTSQSGAKYGMANALQFLAEKKDMSLIIELALDSKNGSTRFAFVDRIASSAGKENLTQIKKILEQLSNDIDKDIASRAKKALQRQKFQ